VSTNVERDVSERSARDGLDVRDVDVAEPAGGELFDDPSAWREEVINRLGLAGEDRGAGASTSPAMPRLIEDFADRLTHEPTGSAADVGGGLGPASWWLARRTGHRFVTVDASASACAGAQRLFGVPAVQAQSSTLPFASGSCGATLLNGIVSLLDELAASVREAVRITRPGGLLAVADLTAAGGRRVTTGTNTFWTDDDLTVALRDAGCAVDYLACCEPGVGRWAAVQSMVHDEIIDRRAGEPGFDEWRRDGEEISSLVAAGRVAATCIVARVPT
jgi:SAM-dependent methyltransferase